MSGSPPPHPRRLSGITNLRELASWRPSGGGTNLALPFTWALERRHVDDGDRALADPGGPGVLNIAAWMARCRR